MDFFYNGGWFSCIMGVSSLFADVYRVLSVRACGCLLHGFGQYWLQFWWQKSFPQYVVHFFLVLSVFYNKFGSLLVTLRLCRWEGRCVLSFVCYGLRVYVVA